VEVFSQQIQEWQMFFATVAGASATLMGLIFLSLSLNLEAVRKAKDESLGQIAWQTFTNFFFLIMFAFVFLVPRQTPLGVGLPLLLICVVAIAITLARTIRAKMAGAALNNVLIESVPSLAAFIGMAAITVLLLLGIADNLMWLLPVVIVLLAVAVRNAWSLLVGVSRKYTK
jgi:hypothetical protein